MKRTFLLALAALLLSLACGQPATAADTVEITHEKGTTAVPVNPTRVVVMDYGTLDSIDYLMEKGAAPAGLSIAMPKQTLPPYLGKYADGKYVNIGALKEFSMEVIASFKPQLIICSLRQQDFYDQLSEIAPTILLNNVPNPYWEGVLANIRALGKIFSAEAVVEEAIAAIEKDAEVATAAAKAKHYKALVLLTNDGKISAYGSGSRFGIIHDKLGVGLADPSIKVGIHGQMVNYEYIAMTNPEFIFVVDRSVAVGGAADGVRILKNDLVDMTTAARNNRIVALDPAVWYLSGGGIESLGIMVREVKEAVEK